MRAVLVVIVLGLLSGCYATTGTPPGPSCAQDPSQPGCLSPIHDKPKPDGGVKK